MNSEGGFPDGNPQKYANVDLTEPLVADQRYCLRLWMNMADSSNYKTRSFHAFLWYGTPTICNYNDTAWDTHAAVTFDISQVDSVEWTLLEGEFIASGGESNITLGAFQFGSEIDSVLLHHSPGGDLAMYFIDNVQLWACQVGVNESIDDPQFAVYPIPASDVLNVSIRGSHLASLVVIDALGRTVTPATWTGRSFGSGTHALDVGALAPGQYLLEVKTRDGVAGTKRFVIAR
ncbi:MAG TPA: T9SS type A sorting domain-containing protein [Flavobacteriales bacterium]|nr:T9SS type A sorting domain-containing protein [Flavobacteriales bacterium]